LSLSQTQIAGNKQQNEQLTARVAPVNAGTPTGTVKVMAGDSTICPDQPLASGTVNCHLAPSQLPAGSYQLTAVYSGDSLFASTTSAATTLTVTSPTTTSLALSNRRVKAGHEGAERLTVNVRPAITGSGTPAARSPSRPAPPPCA
jgi:Bacterial Ig-like domain (group 3)